jgi:hypothetical protein
MLSAIGSFTLYSELYIAWVPLHSFDIAEASVRCSIAQARMVASERNGDSPSPSP